MRRKVRKAGGGQWGAVRRRAAWPLFIATSVTSCFKSSSEMSPGARGASRERVPAVLVEGGSVRGQLVLGEEVTRKVAVVSDMCDVLAGAAWADLLYSLLHIPLYRKLLCIRPFLFANSLISLLESEDHGHVPHLAYGLYTALLPLAFITAVCFTAPPPADEVTSSRTYRREMASRWRPEMASRCREASRRPAWLCAPRTTWPARCTPPAADRAAWASCAPPRSTRRATAASG